MADSALNKGNTDDDIDPTDVDSSAMGAFPDSDVSTSNENSEDPTVVGSPDFTWDQSQKAEMTSVSPSGSGVERNDLTQIVDEHVLPLDGAVLIDPETRETEDLEPQDIQDITDEVESGVKTASESRVRVEEASNTNNALSAETPNRATPPPLPKRATPPPLPQPSKGNREIESESSPEIVIEEEMDESEMVDVGEMLLEEMIQKDKLEENDAYLLVDILIKQYEDPRLLEFLKKVAPSPEDYEVFIHNLDFGKPNDIPFLIQKILVIGHLQDPASGLFLYIGGLYRQQGNIGQIKNALMASPDDLSLKRVLVKNSKDNDISKKALKEEEEIAKKLAYIAERSPNHPGLKHILLPIYACRDYIIMPLVQDSNGNSDTLKSLGYSKESSRDWTKCLVGALRGSTLVSESGIIVTDLKPDNVCNGTDGGVLIDWGGFYDMENGATQFAQTPTYTCNSVIGIETKAEKKAPGTVHKFIVYRILERRFLSETDYPLKGEREGQNSQEERKKIWKNFLYKMDEGENGVERTEHEKLNTVPLEYDKTSLSPPDKLLYDLYLKLHKAHHHPYPFIENDPNNGIDREYISVEGVIGNLETIAKYQ